MLKININSEHVADISDDKELKAATCEVKIGGSSDEIRNELRLLLKALEAKDELYHIWLDELSKWAAKRCKENEHTST